MVKESTIRLMTRLANQYHAINLSQGFTDEAAIYEMVWGSIAASLGGTEEGISRLEEITLQGICQRIKADAGSFLEMKLKDVLEALQYYPLVIQKQDITVPSHHLSDQSASRLGSQSLSIDELNVQQAIKIDLFYALDDRALQVSAHYISQRGMNIGARLSVLGKMNAPKFATRAYHQPRGSALSTGLHSHL